MAKKSRHKMMRSNRLSKMFRARAIIYLKTKGYVFEQTPTSASLFELLEKEQKLEPGVGKAQKIEAYIKLLDSLMNFKGMLSQKSTKEKYQAFYDSPQWREIRYKALKMNNGKCELCGASKADGTMLHVDHIKPRSKFPDLELEISNLQVLCKECNLGKSNKDDTDWRN